MTEKNKKTINLQLLLPISLLILQVIALAGLLIAGYVITPFLISFFFMVSLFLIYRISPQLLVMWRVKHAFMKINDAKDLAKLGKPMRAIKIWKKSLLNLPKYKYLEVLEMIKNTYQEQNMTEAVQQVNAIQSKSALFFDKIQISNQATRRDQRDWQAWEFELQKMIHALPVKERLEVPDAETNQ